MSQNEVPAADESSADRGAVAGVKAALSGFLKEVKGFQDKVETRI